jgi:hypothetical protein
MRYKIGQLFYSGKTVVRLIDITPRGFTLYCVEEDPNWPAWCKGDVLSELTYDIIGAGWHYKRDFSSYYSELKEQFSTDESDFSTTTGTETNHNPIN